jgi:hypothetical protein
MQVSPYRKDGCVLQAQIALQHDSAQYLGIDGDDDRADGHRQGAYGRGHDEANRRQNARDQRNGDDIAAGSHLAGTIRPDPANDSNPI